MNPTSFESRPSVHHPRLALTALVLASCLVTAQSQAQQSRNITLLSNLHLYSDDYSACWGYIHNDGREYVISNTLKGASIVRLTDPAHPVEVKFITLPSSFWHEAKQFREWVYVTTEVFNGQSAERGFEIINMQDPDRPRLVNFGQAGITHAHTVSVDPDRGLLYMNGCSPVFGPSPNIGGYEQTARHGDGFPGFPGSMRIYSLADPENPVQIGIYPRYVHDLHIRGTRGYASMIYDGEVVILDLSDPTNPRELTHIHTPTQSAHSSWTTEDGRYLYVCDEDSGIGPIVYDINDLSNIREVYRFQDLPTHITHNPRILGSRAFVSYYTAGVRLWDLRDPAWPVESGYYDTFPGFDDDFYGDWEVDPYFPSGIIVVNDINTGLYVFRADPINYGIVRGTVRDGQSGPPVAGVTVTVAPGGFTVKSGSDGRFAFAIPPGAATLTATKYGYSPGSKAVQVVLNGDQTIQINVRVKATGTVRGVISSAVSPLGGADVELVGTPFHSAVTNAAGSYEFLSVPEGAVSVRSVRPGYAPRAVSTTVQGGKVAVANISLSSTAFYDDLESGAGWSLETLHDDAETGRWIHAVPALSAYPYAFDPSFIAQPGADHSPDAGTQCFVTGNAPFPRAVFNQSVQNGRTTLTSPDFSLAGIQNPRIGYWRWFLNKIPGLNAENPLVVQISGNGGTTWATAESTHVGPYEWRYAEIPVASIIPGASQARLRFIVSEKDEGFCIVECLVDDIQIYSGGAGGNPAASIASTLEAGAPRATIGAPRPTPTRAGVAMQLILAHPAFVRARVYDLRGRLVRSVFEGSMNAGTSVLRWDGRLGNGERAASGVYWMKTNAGESEKQARIVLVK